MKFWNKSKKYRESWTKVEGPGLYTETKVKRWCQQNTSTGRFYYDDPKWFEDYSNPGLISKGYKWTWYFEIPEDATAFKLVWTGRNTIPLESPAVV